MHATWNFVKRHRGKLAAGAAIVGAFYSTKKLLETDAAIEYVTSLKEMFGGNGASPDEEVECLAEARRHFLFDVHQQSCDKVLRQIVPELNSAIIGRFNTEELLSELRSSSSGLSPERKIHLWDQLKIRSMCRFISLLSIFPLTILVLKSQKAIICQQLCQASAIKRTKRDKTSSILSHRMYHLNAFVDSLLFSGQRDEDVQQQYDLTTLTELFNNLTAYFRTEGIALLMGVIERIVSQTLDKVSLSERFNPNDLLFLVERIRMQIAEISENNCVDFVVPNSKVNLANFGAAENAHFRILLKYLTDVIKSRNASHLLKDFGEKYVEAAMKILEEEMPTPKEPLPLAKVVPILCDIFAKIGTAAFDSVFHSLLSSTELHKFTLFVSECSKSGGSSDANS